MKSGMKIHPKNASQLTLGIHDAAFAPHTKNISSSTELTNENNFILFPPFYNLRPNSNNKRSSRKDNSGENEIKMKIRKGAAQGSGKVIGQLFKLPSIFLFFFHGATS